MDRKLYAKVGPAEEGAKLKDFIRKTWRCSAAMLVLLKTFEDGLTVNGQRVTVNYLVHDGDLVCLSVGDHGADSGFEDTPMPLKILYEDSDVVVVDKPPFLPVHPSKGHVSDTLANGLSAYYHQIGETFVFRCVLRLDRNTSGVVLVAKNAYAHDRLRHQLDDRQIRKEYLALVHGEPAYCGRIDAPVYRPQEATVKRVVDPQGQPAITDYRVEKSSGDLSLLRVFPITGRTHQIRLHLSHLGTPIVSDFLYGEEDDGVLSRHGLHCATVSFLHPVTGKRITVRAPLAEDMAVVAEHLPPAERYYSLDRWLKETYGEKLVKLSLNGGMSCPNRQDGKRGCFFCSAGGSGEFAPSAAISVKEQLSVAKERLRAKWDGYRYIAYFQAYTNTYAPIPYLRELFSQAISDPEVAVLSVATRPDCLGEDVLELLSQLNSVKPVWVELGLQTARDEIARAFGRGYGFDVYRAAAEALRKRGITVITHLIFGLPGETEEDMVSSAVAASRYSDGLKIQMLQVLKGSVWGETYLHAPFPLLSEDDYCDVLCRALSVLPPKTVIHRLTGDPPADLLIAPSWTGNKKKVLAHLRNRLQELEIVQGCLYQNNEE